jgi:hypothetical protein
MMNLLLFCKLTWYFIITAWSCMISANTSLEGKGGAQLHPAIAQLHIGVISEATCIWSKHRNTQQWHLGGLWDCKDHAWPIGPFITTLVTSERARASTSRSSNSKRADASEDISQSWICSLDNAMTSKAIHIIFDCAVRVGSIRWYSGATKGISDVVNSIRRVVNITNNGGVSGAKIKSDRGGTCSRISTRVWSKRYSHFGGIGDIKPGRVFEHRAGRFSRKGKGRIDRS